MIVENVRLENFRNYSFCEIDLSKGMNIFIGNNAQGKTNLLESFVFMSTTRSHRANEDTDMMKNLEEFARVTLKLNEKEIETELQGIISQQGKKLMIQKQPVKRSSEFVGKLNAILFSPTDFELFEGAPRIRRRFMDMEIGKVIPGYVQLLNTYQKLLKERNSYLKEEKVDKNYLEILTEQLAEIAVRIYQKRKEFVDEINKELSQKFECISSEKIEVSIHYDSYIDNSDKKTEVLAKYKKMMDKDIFTRQTNIGIHKDDLSFYLAEKEVNSFASQGQKRMILLSVKSALIGYIERKSHRRAVLLLDDVLSELDEKKQRNLLGMIPEEVQTIITTTSIKDIYSELPKGTKVFEISDGQILSVREVDE